MNELKPVTPAEAREAIGRFNNSHWDNPGEKARYSIPARPDRDDDIRLNQFVDQYEKLEARVKELEAYVAKLGRMTSYMSRDQEAAYEQALEDDEESP